MSRDGPCVERPLTELWRRSIANLRLMLRIRHLATEEGNNKERGQKKKNIYI